MTAVFGLGQVVGPVYAGVVFDLTGSFSAPSLTSAAALFLAAGLVGIGASSRSP
jgi:cyanate permease